MCECPAESAAALVCSCARPAGAVSTGQLNLVDLAGSEKLSKSEVAGLEQSQAIAINKSLFGLKNVIDGLCRYNCRALQCKIDNKTASETKAALEKIHIPYMESDLTKVLKPSLTMGESTEAHRTPPRPHMHSEPFAHRPAPQCSHLHH